jgi:hypothetical protein
MDWTFVIQNNLTLHFYESIEYSGLLRQAVIVARTSGKNVKLLVFLN